MAKYISKRLNGIATGKIEGEGKGEGFEWKNRGSMVFVGDYRVGLSSQDQMSIDADDAGGSRSLGILRDWDPRQDLGAGSMGNVAVVLYDSCYGVAKQAFGAE
jgi:hypothetical protein